MEQMLQSEESPLLSVGGNPAWVFPPEFIKEDLAPQGSVRNAVRTTDVTGKIFYPLSNDSKIAIIRVINSSIL